MSESVPFALAHYRVTAAFEQATQHGKTRPALADV